MALTFNQSMKTGLLNLVFKIIAAEAPQLKHVDFKNSIQTPKCKMLVIHAWTLLFTALCLVAFSQICLV